MLKPDSNYDYVKSELTYIHDLLYDKKSNVEELTKEQVRIGSIFIVTELENEKLKDKTVIMGGNVEPCIHQLAIFFNDHPEALSRFNFWLEKEKSF